MARGNCNLEETIRRSSELAHLATLHRAQLERRLEPGAIDRLAADSAMLRDWSTAAFAARIHKEATTAHLRSCARRGARFVAAFRGAVRATYRADKALLKHFGVGNKVRPDSRASALQALRIVLSAAAKFPSQLPKTGVLPEDVALAKQAFAALQAAGPLKHEQVSVAKAATCDRDLVHRRVEESITRIVAVARLSFVDRPEVTALFESTLPAARGKSRRRRKPAPATDESAAAPA